MDRMEKVVIFGDKGCGKTSFIRSVLKLDFFELYIPTVILDYFKYKQFSIYELTNVNENVTYSVLSNVDHLFLLFSNRKELDFLKSVKLTAPSIIVVLTKNDKLPSHTDRELELLGMSFAESIGAIFKSCSAKKNFGCDTVFTEIEKEKKGVI